MTTPLTSSDVPEPTATGSGRLYRLFWRWHFYAALLVIPFVLWQSVTGTLYLWAGSWMDWRHPELRLVTPAAITTPLSDQVRAALAARPNAAVMEILQPESTDRATTVLLSANNGLPHPVFVDPGNAQVLGQLSTGEWLPGITRGLHGGWPLGESGSWLLELGDSWAIVMIATGLYLWWPRKIGFLRALWPRTAAGARVFWRDLHACVAAWFALLILTFLITALPWTAFWGGQLLKPIQSRWHQENPVGFSPGGASGSTLLDALPALDVAIVNARERGVVGTLQIRLDQQSNAAWWIHNVDCAPGQDRYLLARRSDGAITLDVPEQKNPLMARLIDAGVHLHQGDFGAINRWGNTLVATALIWMSATGFCSWWMRRPRGAPVAPPRSTTAWPTALTIIVVALSLMLPLLGASILVLLGIDTSRKWIVRG